MLKKSAISIRLSLCYFFLLLNSFIQGQDLIVPNLKFVQDSIQSFDNFNIEDGLPHEQALDIIQDKYGFFWIATDYGLSRYDGSKFLNFYHKPNDDKSLSDNKVTRLAEDSNGQLWVGTQNGLNKLNRKDYSFERYYQNKLDKRSLPGNHIRAMLADTSGIMWLETANGFFSRFDTQEGDFENYSHALPILLYSCHTIKKRRNGNLLIFGRSMKGQEFNVKTKKIKDFETIAKFPKAYDLSTFHEEKNGRFWFGVSSGDFIISKLPFKDFEVIEHINNIYDLIEDSKGQVWMGGWSSGLIKINIEKNLFTIYKHNNQTPSSIGSNFINKIYEDKNHDIWIATNNGISKINTNQFIQHIQNNKASNKITDIVPEGDSILWIGTFDEGLFRYNLKTNLYEKNWKNPELLANRIKSLHLDKNGLLWIGFWVGRGFQTMDTKTGLLKQYQLCSTSHYDWWSDILETKKGNIYLSSWGKGPIKFDKEKNDLSLLNWYPIHWERKTNSNFKFIGDNLTLINANRLVFKKKDGKIDFLFYKEIKESTNCKVQNNIYHNKFRQNWTHRNTLWNYYIHKNELWLTSKEGLFKMDTTEYKGEIHTLNTLSDTIIDLAFNKKNIYLLSPQHIFIVEEKHPSLTKQIDLLHPIPPLRTSKVYIQNENLYVCSEDYLQQYNFDKKKWSIIDFSQKKLRDIVFLKDKIWVATSSSIETLRLDNFSTQSIKIDNPMFELVDKINSIALKKEDELWCGTDNGLFFVNLSTQKIVAYFNDRMNPKSIPHDRVYQVDFGPKGALWIASHEGMAKYNISSNDFERYYQDTVRNISSHLSLCMYEDNQGFIWIGNSGGSLDAIHPEKGLFKHYFNEPWDERSLQPDPSESINCIYQDSKNRLWIGGRSLSLFHPSTQDFTHYNDLSDNPFNQVFSILEDEKGQLWLGTNRGLYIFNSDTNAFTYFGLDDNIQGLAFTSAACKLPNGQLVMAGHNGFNIITPDKVLDKNQELEISLYRFLVNDDFYIENLETAITPQLDYNKNTVQVDVAFSHHLKGNQYKYKLLEFEKDWTIKDAHQHTINYQNLPPGNYTLGVIPGNTYSGWSSKQTQICFEIASPFWKEFWFIVPVVLLAATLAFLLGRWQYKKTVAAEKKNLRLQFLEVKSLQSQMNPHFIFNVLQSIQNLIIKSNLEEANSNLVNLSTLMRRFLDSSVSMELSDKFNHKNEIPIEVEKELLELYIGFEQSVYKNKFDSHFVVDERLLNANYTIPSMIIQPYIENAIKHGLLPRQTKGVLNVEFMLLAGEAFQCTIEDNGIGREKSKEIKKSSSKNHQSHGTNLVAQRVEVLNQVGYNIQINTYDRPNHGGTLVTIIIDKKYDA